MRKLMSGMCGLAALLGSTALAQVTERVSVDSSGAQGHGDSGYFRSSISADGRYVAFASDAPDLVPGDTNGSRDVFVRDRLNGTTERVSTDAGGVQGNADSHDPGLSADGRFVTFESLASNLVPGDSNAVSDIFVRDRLTGTTERVSVDSSGVQGNLASFAPSISADGRLVAFASAASNLVANDTNARGDVFVRDRLLGTTQRVSVSSAGAQASGASDEPAISADGRFVSFDCGASNLIAGDTNNDEDLFAAISSPERPSM
jgi:Tol biopolymer transport system component